MKKLYLFLMLLLPAVGFAQTITVSGAGTANYGSVSLNGTYTFAGTVNGKNSYSQNFSFEANGCYNCSASSSISWDGVSAWVLKTQGSGFCSYCNYNTPIARTNTTATTLNPPCSGWPDGMNISGACEGGVIQDFALSTNNVCPSGTVTLSWINAVALGAGNIFTATLSDKYGSFSSGTVLLGSSASATATNMNVTIPADRESGGAYAIKLTASEAPSSPVSLTSPSITIGLPNDRPSVYQGEIEACVGQAVSMSTSSSYDSYQWFKVASNVYTAIPGATSQSYSIPSVLETSQGHYSVQGKTAGGCVTLFSYPIPLNVSNAPVIDYLYPSNVNVCEGNTSSQLGVNMDNSVSGLYTFDWKKGGNTVKMETTTSYGSSFSPSLGWQVGDAGQYTVVVSKVGCASSITSQIATARVDAPITTPPSVTPTGTQVAPVTLTPGGGYQSYQLLKWNGTAYVAVNYSSSSFSVTQAGKYVVAAENICGISGYSNEVTVTTVCSTPPTISPAAPTTLPVTLTASVGFDDYVWFKWNGSSYQSQGTGSTLNVTTPGQFAVKGYAYSCGYSDYSTSVTVAVLCTTTQSGDWSNPDIWSCGRVPVTTDNAKIETGHAVNLSAGTQNVNQLTNNGTITGSGSIGGSLYNNATIAPGNSPGTIGVLDFTGTASSVINAEISTQSAYDKLAVTGAAALNGILNVVFIDAFVPTLGDAFEFITYGSHSGTFTTINLPALPSGLGWKTEYNATALKLSVIVNSLPVTLVSFSANVTGDRKVKLTWSTAEEINASHFYAERSADAREFEVVGKVSASGTTKLHKDYSLIDEIPLSGTSYYRLRQIDLDGKEFVYRVIAVHLDAAFGQLIFPNPTDKDMIQMTFKGALPGIKLTDLNGRSIPVTLSQTATSTLVIKPKSPLAPGLYILTAEDGGKQVRHKVVIGE